MDNSIINFIKKDQHIIPSLVPKLKPIRVSSNNLLELSEMPTLELNNINEKETQTYIPEVVNMYRLSLKWYALYLLYGFMGGIFINSITNNKIIIFDMIFNIILSPIIYYNAPRKILTRITTKEFLLYYTLSFIIGLLFRFLDYIPMLSHFTLNFDNISSTIQIILTSIICIVITLIIIYYIYISSEPIINTLLFIIMTLIISITCYYYHNMGGNIHIHHYFVGMIIMLLSKNSKYKLVIVIHAIGYAIYIEGVSKWGYAPIFWHEP